MWDKLREAGLIQEDEKPSLGVDPKHENDLRLYDKVGGYYGWSYQEYEETPPWVINGLSDLIDEKLSYYGGDGDSEEEGLPPVNYTHLALIIALSKLFGG